MRVERARWLAFIWLLAGSSLALGVLAAESVLPKDAFIVSLAGVAGALILFGWRLAHELERRNDRLHILAEIVERSGGVKLMSV